MKNKTFIDSLKCAFRGLYIAHKYEKNFKIYYLIALTFLVINFKFKVDAIYWVGYILSSFAVFAAELVNTAIERLCDAITKEYNDLIREAKDIAASAVLFFGFCFFIIEIIAIYKATIGR